MRNIDKLIEKINEQNTGFSIMLEVLITAQEKHGVELTEDRARAITAMIGEDDEFLTMLDRKIAEYINEEE